MKTKGMNWLCSGLLYFLSLSSAHAEIKIGVLFYDPPLVISATQGFHVELANKICQGLNEPCVILPMTWNHLFQALDKREIDLQMGAFPTPQRALKYIFSIPYLPSFGRFITLSSNQLNDVTQLKGKNVGVLKEENDTGVFQNYIRATYVNLFNMVEFEEIGNLLSALRDNKIQAAMLHSTLVNYWVSNSNGSLNPIGPAFHLGDGYTLMALPLNQQLINSINEQIRQLTTSKELERLQRIYFGN